MKKRSRFLKEAVVRRGRGFTLLEVVTAFVCLAIVAAMAIPIFAVGGNVAHGAHNGSSAVAGR